MAYDAELDELLRWVVENHMAEPREGRTTVSSAGVDRAAGVVVVALSREDEDYAAGLVEASGGRIVVEPQPTRVIALPPAWVRAPVQDKRPGSRDARPGRGRRTDR